REPGLQAPHGERALRHAHPEDARPFEPRECAQAMQPQEEGLDCARGMLQRAERGGQPLLALLAQEREREVQIGPRDPGHCPTERAQPIHLGRHRIARLGAEGNRDEGPRHQARSARRSISSAAWADCHFTASRPPANRNRRTSTPAGDATPTKTVPTGFSGDPPSGPAMPVMATPQAVPPMRQAPRAMASATGALTAPCARMRSAGTPRRSVLASFEYTTTPRST